MKLPYNYYEKGDLYMKILEKQNGFASVGGVNGCGPQFMDVAAAEAKVKCNDGSILYVSLCWVSEGPEELNQYICDKPLLDALIDEEMSDESADRMEAASGVSYSEEQLSNDEFADIYEELRLQVIAALDAQEFYHGMFKEDAFTDNWDYDEAMDEYDEEEEDDEEEEG